MGDGYLYGSGLCAVFGFTLIDHDSYDVIVRTGR